MFKNVDNNKKMLQGAYRKLKSYYYYNKNFLVMRKKIAEFEADPHQMDQTFDMLAMLLYHPRSENSKSLIEALINTIDFYVIPKKFDSDTFVGNSVITNTTPRDKKMKTVNFFIDAPIELHILDTLWTIFLAKMDRDNKIISKNVYGNTINKFALFSDDEICFENRNLFNRYFNKYTAWRNDAFEMLETQYRFKRDSLLISLDVKSYFYSVSFSFRKLKKYFNNHESIISISPLAKIIEKMYAKYYEKIAPFRLDLTKHGKNKYPLPIGLFSSMILANVYLTDFDNKVSKTPGVMFYGRYVDDILLVVDRKVEKSESATTLLKSVLVDTGLFRQKGSNFVFANYEELYVQSSKIKLLYIDHTESRAIIDIYNDTIRMTPSQMDPLPENNLNLPAFDEMAYSIENFTKEKKIRDIGLMEVDAFKVGRFFSALPRRYSQINVQSASKQISTHIEQIEKFFTGSQGVEFHNNWLNYMYFLVITGNNVRLHSFIATIKGQFQDLKANSLDKAIFRRTASVNKKAKEFLQSYLDICLELSLCLDAPFAKKHFARSWARVQKYIHANIFEHSLVTFPLANYLDYEDESKVSFCKMSLNDIGRYPKIEESFKFKWSPRFIHYDELLLLLFYHYHIHNKHGTQYQYAKDSLVDKFMLVNHLKGSPFKIDTQDDTGLKDYLMRTIRIPSVRRGDPNKVEVAIGSINISQEKCIAPCKNRWANITLKEKDSFFVILRQAFEYFSSHKEKPPFSWFNKQPMLLVLPELCFPLYWINDLIRFAKRSQIGIVTGLQYLNDETNRKYNYIASILPFETGKQHYRNTFVYIREKNDYSPIEFEGLAKLGYTCKNRECAEYQIFDWNGIRVAPFICYELTDIVARALLKGKCDFITASVFNPDTTYFSNIIDSTVRDLHAFVIQANTSYYGDSRITGPYDRDSKDVFKLKGGDNDHVVIGTVDFNKYRRFQVEYYANFEERLARIESERKSKKDSSSHEKRTKPDIKRFSARFKLKK